MRSSIAKVNIKYKRNSQINSIRNNSVTNYNNISIVYNIIQRKLTKSKTERFCNSTLV